MRRQIALSNRRYDEAEETLTLLRQFHSAFTAKPQTAAFACDFNSRQPFVGNRWWLVASPLILEIVRALAVNLLYRRSS
jgi:hypothetical protein